MANESFQFAVGAARVGLNRARDEVHDASAPKPPTSDVGNDRPGGAPETSVAQLPAALSENEIVPLRAHFGFAPDWARPTSHMPSSTRTCRKRGSPTGQ